MKSVLREDAVRCYDLLVEVRRAMVQARVADPLNVEGHLNAADGFLVQAMNLLHPDLDAWLVERGYGGS